MTKKPVKNEKKPNLIIIIALAAVLLLAVLAVILLIKPEKPTTLPLCVNTSVTSSLLACVTTSNPDSV